MYCPVCENIPLDVCPTDACIQWRQEIGVQLADGKTPDEIKANTLQIRTGTAGNHAEFKGQWKKDDSWFVTTGYIGDSIFAKLDKSGIQYEIVKETEGGFWQQVLITWLPMIVLVVLFLVFMRQLQVGGGKAMSFGKSKARMLSDSQNKVTSAETTPDILPVVSFTITTHARSPW